jgi:hypothetical protein
VQQIAAKLQVAKSTLYVYLRHRGVAIGALQPPAALSGAAPIPSIGFEAPEENRSGPCCGAPLSRQTSAARRTGRTRWRREDTTDLGCSAWCTSAGRCHGGRGGPCDGSNKATKHTRRRAYAQGVCIPIESHPPCVLSVGEGR